MLVTERRVEMVVLILTKVKALHEAFFFLFRLSRWGSLRLASLVAKIERLDLDSPQIRIRVPAHFYSIGSLGLLNNSS